MKKQVFILLLCLLSSVNLKAQNKLKYHEVTELPLIGKADFKSPHRYFRFPDELQDKLRPRVWELSTHSSGMAIRFRSNTTSIAVKWEVLYDYGMNHMTDTGIKGLDLYCLDEHQDWQFVKSARPKGKKNASTIITHMPSKDREYMLYLPLYDGILDLQIGIDSTSYLSVPKIKDIQTQKPIVFYGTSILQGACASRPGMSFTNIISRTLHRECLNYGFSGNAFLDLEIAAFISEIDAGVFVLDFMPNASVQQINDRLKKFYLLLRQKHPHVPILLIEDPIFNYTAFDQKKAEEVYEKNEALKTIYQQLLGSGDKNLHLISSKSFIEIYKNGTVDGTHLTDLGMSQYADLLIPWLKSLLKEPQKDKE